MLAAMKKYIYIHIYIYTVSNVICTVSNEHIPTYCIERCVARLHCQDRALVLRAWRRLRPTTPKRLALVVWAFAVLGVDVASAVSWIRIVFRSYMTIN